MWVQRQRALIAGAVALLEGGTSPHSIDKEGRTALHYCARRPSCQAVLRLAELLIKYGADVDAVDARGALRRFDRFGLCPISFCVTRGLCADEAPLHMAARVGSVEFCELLLTHKALVDCDPSCRERTPLHVAASCGHTAVAELLLEHGAECTAPDSDGRTPMAAAEAAGAHRVRVMRPILSTRSAASPAPTAAKEDGGDCGHKLRRSIARPATAQTRHLSDRQAFAALWGAHRTH